MSLLVGGTYPPTSPSSRDRCYESSSVWRSVGVSFFPKYFCFCSEHNVSDCPNNYWEGVFLWFIADFLTVQHFHLLGSLYIKIYKGMITWCTLWAKGVGKVWNKIKLS